MSFIIFGEHLNVYIVGTAYKNKKRRARWVVP